MWSLGICGLVAYEALSTLGIFYKTTGFFFFTYVQLSKRRKTLKMMKYFLFLDQAFVNRDILAGGK